MENGLKTFNIGFEYVLSYSKTPEFMFSPIFKEASEERKSKGYWKGFWNDADRPTMRYDILGFAPDTGQWKWKKETALQAVENYQKYLQEFSNDYSLEEYWGKTGKKLRFIRRKSTGRGKNQGVDNWIAPSDGILRNTNWLDILATAGDKSSQGLFDYPKNKELIKSIIQSSFISSGDIILDFFAGSSTTAHAILELNTEDNLERKFIQVQLPEATNENDDAFKAGYKNICEIGKERIRRASNTVKKETGADIDYGFRVYRLDESNMLDVYYKPQEYKQTQLDAFADNVKPDRTADDLLAQVMLDWGLPLSLKIEQASINGKQLFKVNDNSLFACFVNGIDEAFAKEIAKEAPLRIVFKDSGFENDTAKVNVKQLLKQLSPETEIKVI
jgi:adenine-specific DNA-methyltransferase